jgi:DNA-binding protein Fis
MAPHASLSANSIAQNHIHSSTAEAKDPLRSHVERVVREYFITLGDESPTDLYELILKEVELPLLTVVLEKTRGNQTRCAQILGLNRGTLRKKLKCYNLM